jgi:hypothetical protein
MLFSTFGMLSGSLVSKHGEPFWFPPHTCTVPVIRGYWRMTRTTDKCCPQYGGRLCRGQAQHLSGHEIETGWICWVQLRRLYLEKATERSLRNVVFSIKYNIQNRTLVLHTHYLLRNSRLREVCRISSAMCLYNILYCFTDSVCSSYFCPLFSQSHSVHMP